MFYFFLRKTQKVIVDHIKVVLKSGTKSPAREKLRALNLLHKCLMAARKNKEFVKYT